MTSTTTVTKVVLLVTSVKEKVFAGKVLSPSLNEVVWKRKKCQLCVELRVEKEEKRSKKEKERVTEISIQPLPTKMLNLPLTHKYNLYTYDLSLWVHVA